MSGFVRLRSKRKYVVSGHLCFLHNDKVFQETFTTAKGQTLTYALSDGSRLILNTDGRVQVKYSNLQRLFILERGEMNIQVAHDLTRPLNVVAGNKVVQAVGTAFNVQIYDNREVELIVTPPTRLHCPKFVSWITMITFSWIFVQQKPVLYMNCQQGSS